MTEHEQIPLAELVGPSNSSRCLITGDKCSPRTIQPCHAIELAETKRNLLRYEYLWYFDPGTYDQHNPYNLIYLCEPWKQLFDEGGFGLLPQNPRTMERILEGMNITGGRINWATYESTITQEGADYTFMPLNLLFEPMPVHRPVDESNRDITEETGGIRDYKPIKPPYSRLIITCILHPFPAIVHFMRHLTKLRAKNATFQARWDARASEEQRYRLELAEKIWIKWKAVPLPALYKLPVTNTEPANPRAGPSIDMQTKESRGMKRGAHSVVDPNGSVDSRKRQRTSDTRDDTMAPVPRTAASTSSSQESDSSGSTPIYSDWDPVACRKEGKAVDVGSLLSFPPLPPREQTADTSVRSDQRTLASDRYLGGDDDPSTYNPLPRFAPSEPLDICDWAESIAKAATMRTLEEQPHSPPDPRGDDISLEYHKEKARSPPTTEWRQWVPDFARL